MSHLVVLVPGNLPKVNKRSSYCDVQQQNGPVHINITLIGDQNRLVSESINKDKIENVNYIEYIAPEHDANTVAAEPPVR